MKFDDLLKTGQLKPEHTSKQKLAEFFAVCRRGDICGEIQPA